MNRPLDILQISPRLPYPPEDGGSIGVYNITRFVARRGHKVTFACFGDPSADRGDMEQFCDAHVVAHDNRNRPFGMLRNLSSSLPYTVSKYRRDAMSALLRQLCTVHRFDVVHVDHAHLAWYGELLQREFGLPWLLREHNYESRIYERFAARHHLPLLSGYLRMQARRWTAYECAALQHPDCVAAITPEDAAVIRKLTVRPVRIIPAGVDTETLQPFDPAAADEAHVVLLGSLRWLPNRDAAQWFVEEIWPAVRERVPRASCTVAGSHPPQSLRARASDHLSVPGYVNDLSALLARATVVAVPLRVGGGMRIKLLEFFARGKAVVSTRIGAEGNSAQHGTHILHADTPEEFADAITRLITDADLRRSFGAAGRELVEQQYSWHSVAAAFETAYRDILH